MRVCPNTPLHFILPHKEDSVGWYRRHPITHFERVDPLVRMIHVRPYILGRVTIGSRPVNQ